MDIFWCNQAKPNTMGQYLQFSHWRAWRTTSTTSAFRCSSLGIMHFPQGHPDCNYRFTADAFLPGLEILKGGSGGCPYCGGGGGGGRGGDLWYIYYPIKPRITVCLPGVVELGQKKKKELIYQQTQCLFILGKKLHVLHFVWINHFFFSNHSHQERAQ